DNGPPLITPDPTAAAQGIPNFYQESNGIYRGSAPSSANSFNWLKTEKQVGVEIDLQGSDNPAQDSQWAQQAGINHVGIGMSDVGTPTGDQLNQFFSAIDGAQKAQGSNPEGYNNVFIHGADGNYSTGTMIALNNIRNGMNPDYAVYDAQLHGL